MLEATMPTKNVIICLMNQMTHSFKIYNAFLGAWEYTRSITGQPMSGKVKGKAIFHQLDNNDLAYEEQGEFLIDGTPLIQKVTKSYCYRYHTQSDAIQVFFSDTINYQELFHELQVSRDSNNIMIAHGKHLCGKDHYTTEYTFPVVPFTQFDIKHAVIGPKKNYIAKTTYQRVCAEN